MKLIILLLISIFTLVPRHIVISLRLDSKIVRGTYDEPITGKFIVSFRRNGTHICCGCLISNKDVLTAAQCIHKILKFEENFVWDIAAFVNGNRYKIAHMKPHPYYNYKRLTTSSYNDLGLIELKVTLDLNLEWSANLDSISIPVAKQFIKPGKKATILSWNYNCMQKKYAVQKMKIQIEDDETCDERINPKTYKSFFGNRQMCGTPLKYGQRVLLADAGSPLIYKDHIIGIVTPRQKFYDDLGTVIIMRVNNIQEHFPEVILTSIQYNQSTTLN